MTSSGERSACWRHQSHVLCDVVGSLVCVWNEQKFGLNWKPRWRVVFAVSLSVRVDNVVWRTDLVSVATLSERHIHDNLIAQLASSTVYLVWSYKHWNVRGLRVKLDFDCAKNAQLSYFKVEFGQSRVMPQWRHVSIRQRVAILADSISSLPPRNLNIYSIGWHSWLWPGLSPKQACRYLVSAARDERASHLSILSCLSWYVWFMVPFYSG